MRATAFWAPVLTVLASCGSNGSGDAGSVTDTSADLSVAEADVGMDVADTGFDGGAMDGAAANDALADSRVRDAMQDVTVDAPAITDAGLSPPPTGVFVPTFGSVLNSQVFSVSGVARAYVSVGWDQVQPTSGDASATDWSRLDQQLAVIPAGTPFTISLGAGASTPHWVYATGVPSLMLTTWELARQQCATNSFPVVWNANYLQAYDAVVDLLVQHLHQVGRYASVAAVKIEGVNATTDETSLPYRPAMTYSGCTTSDAPTAWVAQGYTPQLVEGAWQAIANHYAQAFADKYLDIQIIREGFPAIDSSGSVYDAGMGGVGDPTVTTALIQLGLSMFPGRFIVQTNGLKSVPGSESSGPVETAAQHGAYVGWQMFYWVYGDDPACRMNNGEPASGMCDMGVLAAADDNGVNNGAHFLEIYETDVLHFPSEIARVASMLH